MPLTGHGGSSPPSDTVLTPPVDKRLSLTHQIGYRRGKIEVKVACTGTAACRGTVRIKKGKTTIGSRSYTVAGGKSGTVTVKPSRRGARSLGSRRSQTVSVELKPSTGNAVKKSLKLRR